MKLTCLLIGSLLCGGFLSHAADRGAATINTAKPPTQGEILKNGIGLKDSFAQYRIRIRSHVPPKPPPDGQGVTLEAKDVGDITLITDGSSLRFPCHRVLAYFPPDEVSRQSLKEWPRVLEDSKVGWLHISGRGTREQLQPAVLGFIKGVGGDPSDLQAWFDHRMWQTTQGFFKIYGEDPQIKISVNVANQEGKEVAGLFIQVDWLNNLRKAEQAGADQPTTAPELKSDGKDKPQPESKVAPR